jgi:hypothetical protein
MKIIKYLFGPLLFQKPLSYEFAGSIDDEVKRLRRIVMGAVFHSPFQQCVVGRVSEAKVVLRRYRPFCNNSFIPVFRGQFILKNGKSALEGKYSMHMFAKVFMCIWLAGVIAGGIMIRFTSFNQVEAKVSFCITAMMFLFGMALMHLGWLIGKKDIDYIDSNIKRTIYKSPTDRSSL